MRITGAQVNRKCFLHFINLVIHKRDVPTPGGWVTRRHDQLHWCGSKVKVGWRGRGEKKNGERERRKEGEERGRMERGRGGKKERREEEERREGEERGRRVEKERLLTIKEDTGKRSKPVFVV